MDAYDDYSNVLADNNFDDNYKVPNDAYAVQDNNSDPIDLRIPASTTELDAREEALIMLEKNLIEKSKQLQDRDLKLQGSGVVEDNWPCAAYPVTYHSISSEIPLQYQSFIRRHYWVLKLTMFALMWNFLTMLVLYIEDRVSSVKLLWATIYFICGIPGAWKFWYKPIYRAVESDKRVKFVQYFLFSVCHTIFALVASIGVQETALMGFMSMIDAMNINTATGVTAVIACAAWVLISIASIIMLRRTYRLYKSRGGDLQKDSAAFRSDVAGNVAAGKMVIQGVNAAR